MPKEALIGEHNPLALEIESFTQLPTICLTFKTTLVVFIVNITAPHVITHTHLQCMHSKLCLTQKCCVEYFVGDP